MSTEINARVVLKEKMKFTGETRGQSIAIDHTPALGRWPGVDRSGTFADKFGYLQRHTGDQPFAKNETSRHRL